MERRRNEQFGQLRRSFAEHRRAQLELNTQNFVAGEVRHDGGAQEQRRKQVEHDACEVLHGRKPHRRSAQVPRQQRQTEAQHRIAFAQLKRAQPRARWFEGWKFGWRGRIERLSGAILELQAGEPRVEAAARAEARMCAFLDDLPAVHHHDPVGGAHRCQAMRDNNGRAMLHQPV